MSAQEHPNRSRLTIRRARWDEAEQLAALARKTFVDAFAVDNDSADMDTYVEQAFSPDRIGSEIADDANTFLVAHLPGSDALIGYAKVRPAHPNSCAVGPEPVELERLYVSEHVLGKGVGAELMRTVLDGSRRAGHETVWLGVWERNFRAIAFYQSWGFAAVGEHVFRLGSDDQTDLIMARSLI